MQFAEERNVLRIGPPEHLGEIEITLAMVDAVRQRINDAGGILAVWVVLHEDVYESKSGGGFYLVWSYVERPPRQELFQTLLQRERCGHMSGLT